jgi:hypothetical protein
LKQEDGTGERANRLQRDESRDPPIAFAWRKRLETLDRSATGGLIRFCANAVLVTALLPYVSIVVQPSLDVQLMALATACAALLALFLLTPGLLTVCRMDLYVFAIGLLTLLYVDPEIAAIDLQATLRGCAPIVLAFPVYFAVRNLYRFMSPRVFVATVIFYALVLLIQLRLPTVYTALFSHVLSDVRWTPETGRGPNVLCPEPSMMGNMCVLFAVSLCFFHREYWQQHKSAARFVVAVSLVMLFLTKSATGVVLALAVALAALLGSRRSARTKAEVVATLAVGVLALGTLSNSSDARGSLILASIARNPLLVLQDYSFGERCVGLFVGLYALPAAPFGSGDVRINVGLTNKALNGSVAAYLWPDGTFRNFLVDITSIHSNNLGLGSMVQRMGLAGIGAAAALVFFVRGFSGAWAVRLFVIGLFLNASLFMPTLWFVLGCSAELERTADAGTAGTRRRGIAAILRSRAGQGDGTR